MSFSTVTELIKVLQEFDPATPVLKSDLNGFTYSNISITGNLLFKVRPVYQWTDRLEADNDLYQDAEGNSTECFDAIVL